MNKIFTDISEKTKSAVSDLSANIKTSATSAIEFGEKTVTTVKQHGTDLSKGLGQATNEFVAVAGAALTETTNITERTLSTIVTTAFDQNGDGQLDQEDVRIATAKCVSAIKEASKELSKEIASSSLAKETATAAVVGAAIAVPVPIIGPVAGATIGATIGAYKHFTKK